MLDAATPSGSGTNSDGPMNMLRCSSVALLPWWLGLDALTTAEPIAAMAVCAEELPFSSASIQAFAMLLTCPEYPKRGSCLKTHRPFSSANVQAFAVH